MKNSILHLIRISPHSRENELIQCINTLSINDSVLLMDDGVYVLTHKLLDELLSASSAIYIISEHTESRGMAVSDKTKNIQLSDITQLIFSHQSSVTWQ